MRTREVDAANDVKNKTFGNDDRQFDFDTDSSASVLGVYPRITGSVFGLVLFAAMMQIHWAATIYKIVKDGQPRAMRRDAVERW